jgi:hypothetical protein
LKDSGTVDGQSCVAYMDGGLTAHEKDVRRIYIQIVKVDAVLVDVIDLLVTFRKCQTHPADRYGGGTDLLLLWSSALLCSQYAK